MKLISPLEDEVEEWNGESFVETGEWTGLESVLEGGVQGGVESGVESGRWVWQLDR